MNSESRMMKKKGKIHDNILQVASRIISEKGSSNITFEALSLEADVARKTIYNHFENKSVLIEELIYPICEHAKEFLAEKSNNVQVELDDIWEYCIELWKNPALNAPLLYQIADEDYPQIGEIKKGFLILFKRLLIRIEAFNKLDDRQISILADLIYNTYLPLLQSLSDYPDYELAFKACMSGMLNGIFEQMKTNK